jgi:putative PIN family toxin of toxin-antitoxin system
MPKPQIVIDTNVLIAGLRSNRGRAFQLLSLVGTDAFDIHLSVPLVFEYEEVLLRELPRLAMSESDVQSLINYHCAAAQHHEIFFLWRPYLTDADDDMLLELAVKAGCEFIVTFNKTDFAGIDKFGLQAVTPAEFLTRIGKLP